MTLVGLIVAATACGGRPAPTTVPQPHTERGLASWYGKPFHGRTTASGERYDMHALTAAHRTLDFGTRVRVERPGRGGAVIVRINDRGPFVDGRIIDLSRAAAKKLGMIEAGVAEVRITVVEDPG